MTRASDLAKLLGAGATINDGTTITTADNTTQLTLTSTDADAAVGPVLGFNRNSASAADSDLLGRLSFIGKNDAGEDVDYGIIRYKIDDASNGTEDADIAIRRMVAGTSTNVLNFKASETIFNEDSADIDFRVEGNGNTHALFVEGSSDRVGIGTSSMAEPLRVQADSGTDFSASGAAFNNAIMLKNATAGAANTVSLAMATETNGEVYLSAVQNSANDAADFVISTRDSGARAERLRVKSDGAVTMPLQPAFNVTMSSNSAQFGNGQFFPTLDTEIFDQGGDFSSNTFTAPVTGRYYLSWLVYGANLDTDASYYYINIITSNRTYSQYLYTSSFDTDMLYYGWNTSVLADMDANDTATFAIGQVNGHSTSQVYAAHTYATGGLFC